MYHRNGGVGRLANHFKHRGAEGSRSVFELGLPDRRAHLTEREKVSMLVAGNIRQAFREGGRVGRTVGVPHPVYKARAGFETTVLAGYEIAGTKSAEIKSFHADKSRLLT